MQWAVYVSVELRSWSLHQPTTTDTRFTGRLPRPFRYFRVSCSPIAGARNAEAHVTARNKAVSCWHSSVSLLAASGRLGGAASGRYYVVKFVKRNPTKCSGRFMSVLGCAPASLHPTYDPSVSVRLYLAVTRNPLPAGLLAPGLHCLAKGCGSSPLNVGLVHKFSGRK